MPLKNVIKELFMLLSIAVIAAFAANYFSPKGIALVGEWDTRQGVITPKPKEDVVVHELEIEDPFAAKKVYDSGNAIFVDARDVEQYREGHLNGAVSLPVYQFEEFIGGFKDEYPIDLPIITYCSGRECDDSHALAQRLLEEGYMDVRIFIDGYPAWEAEGFPIEQK